MPFLILNMRKYHVKSQEHEKYNNTSKRFWPHCLFCKWKMGFFYLGAFAFLHQTTGLGHINSIFY